MHSHAARIRAVKRYIKLGRRLSATIRQLGYRIVGRAPNVQHAQAVKNAAVIELCTRTTSAQEVADKVAVCRPTLYNWKNQLLGREAPASMKLHNEPPPTPDMIELRQQVESLQKDIRRLQLEHELLKKANELLKKGLGVAPQLLSNREKSLLVDALKHIYSRSELLAELDLARSSYFYHCARLRQPDKYADARVAITDVFQSNHRCYGYRRMRAALDRRHLHLSEKVVQSLMKQECLVVAANKKASATFVL
jgi:putative transposase